jgi:hypothetical protein
LDLVLAKEVINNLYDIVLESPGDKNGFVKVPGPG